MLNRIKLAIANLRIKPLGDVQIFSPTSHQEDTRSIQSIKRVKQVFEDNHEYIMTRSMRPHGPFCEDPSICDDITCYKWEPDKIVSKPYLVDKKSGNKIK